MNFIDVQNVLQLNAFNSFVNFKFQTGERIGIKKNDISSVWKKLFHVNKKLWLAYEYAWGCIYLNFITAYMTVTIADNNKV